MAGARGEAHQLDGLVRGDPTGNTEKSRAIVEASREGGPGKEAGSEAWPARRATDDAARRDPRRASATGTCT